MDRTQDQNCLVDRIEAHCWMESRTARCQLVRYTADPMSFEVEVGSQTTSADPVRASMSLMEREMPYIEVYLNRAEDLENCSAACCRPVIPGW